MLHPEAVLVSHTDLFAKCSGVFAHLLIFPQKVKTLARIFSVIPDPTYRTSGEELSYPKKVPNFVKKMEICQNRRLLGAPEGSEKVPDILTGFSRKIRVSGGRYRLKAKPSRKSPKFSTKIGKQGREPAGCWPM